MSLFKLDTSKWYVLRINLLIAGVFITLSAILAYFISINWLIFTVFIGLMLSIFALTGYCPSSMFLAKLGVQTKCGEKK